MNLSTLIGIAATIAAASGPHYHVHRYVVVAPHHRTVHTHTPQTQTVRREQPGEFNPKAVWDGSR